MLCALLIAIAAFGASKSQKGFAIVVDPVTYNKVKADVDAYAKAIEEKEGLKTYIVVDKWGKPDPIRQELYKLYSQKTAPIEGAVFIGDIPVAMIRDAQHLTSAFKMDQIKNDWKECSVPSDRFYDDFGLKFDYIKQDSTESLYHYYTLRADGAQKLQPNLYTGRIKANDDLGTSRYEKISNYLRRAVVEKYSNNTMDQMLFFSGHGYVSESVGARIDEKVALLENFPWLKKQQNGIEYIDHSRDIAVKTRVKNELQRKDIDLAILHHHGDSEIEYFNGTPSTSNTLEMKKYMQQFLREMLRYYKEKGKNVEEEKARLKLKYDSLPEYWFRDAFDSAQIVKDSLFDESLDLYYKEYGEYKPNVKMVIMDACYNGSFHKDRSIGAGYIFMGTTMVAFGNSVNVLQDKWSDRYVGLMGLGMRAGRMAQLNPYLEGHIIGDPTYHFADASALPFNLNDAISNEDAAFWKEQLKSNNVALRCIAMRRLVDLEPATTSSLLLNRFRESESYVERMEAMVLLSTYDNQDFIDCLKLALNDSYEMTQRFATNFVGKVGDPQLVPEFINVISRNNTSERIEFDAKMAISLLPQDKMIDEFEKWYANNEYYMERDKVHDQIREAIIVESERWQDEVAKIYNDTIKQGLKSQCCRYLRNNPVHPEASNLAEYAQRCDNEHVAVTLWEALGWFNLSYRRQEIADVALKVSKDSKYPKAVRNEALKTYNRIMSTGR